MSIVSDVIKNVQSGMPLSKVWSLATAQLSTWTTQQKTANPILATAIDETEAGIKQGLSDALSLADSAMGAHMAPAVAAVEGALDVAWASATGGTAQAAIPLINAGVSGMANIMRTAIDAWEAKTQASLAPVKSS